MHPACVCSQAHDIPAGDDGDTNSKLAKLHVAVKDFLEQEREKFFNDGESGSFSGEDVVVDADVKPDVEFSGAHENVKKRVQDSIEDELEGFTKRLRTFCDERVGQIEGAIKSVHTTAVAETVSAVDGSSSRKKEEMNQHGEDVINKLQTRLDAKLQNAVEQPDTRKTYRFIETERPTCS